MKDVAIQKYMPKKQAHNKGVIVSAITYPVLILLLVFSMGAFVSSINSKAQTRAHFDLMQAEYNALKGIEYTFEEVNSGLGVNFITHSVDNDTLELIPVSNPPNTTINGTYINTADRAYCLGDQVGNPDFCAKVYKFNDEVFILAKGGSGGKEKLFINKISGTSLYEYLAFFPNNANFGWFDWDAQGGKIHANGNILFNEYTTISNVLELSSEGKMYWNYYQSIYPGEEDSYPTRRFPYITPQGYNVPGANDIGSYVNKTDGHYAGDRSGLYMYNEVSGQLEPWDPVPNPGDPDPANRFKGSYPPISPWSDGSGGFSVTLEGGIPATVTWDAAHAGYASRYQQQDVNCGVSCEPYAANIIINGTVIPNRLPGGPSYTTPKYYGASHAETVSVNLTDSDLQADAWDNFIASVALDYNPADPHTVKGLAGVVKTNQPHVSPPNISVDNLIADAQSAGQGMVIQDDVDAGEIVIRINCEAADKCTAGTEVVLDATTTSIGLDTCGAGASSETVFAKKEFINHQSMKENSVVEINMENLALCEGAESGQWLPANGIIYSQGSPTNGAGETVSPRGLAITNAKELPVALTTVVAGNLILKGDFNDPDDSADWVPTAAIVSNKVYLVSKEYNYPDYITVTQHHANYPYEETFAIGKNVFTLPAGTGWDKDFAEGTMTPEGYNWLFHHDPDIETNTFKMANKVRKDDGTTTYNYNISLIGKYAYNPEFLELWNYYEDPGDDSTPAQEVQGNVFKQYDAVVTGAFVQLSDEFPKIGLLDGRFNRNCNDAGGNPIAYDAGFPCRAAAVSDGAPWDLMAHNGEEDKKYEKQYVTDALRPPGDLLGFSQSILLQLDLSSWDYHPDYL